MSRRNWFNHSQSYYNLLMLYKKHQSLSSLSALNLLMKKKLKLQSQGLENEKRIKMNETSRAGTTGKKVQKKY